MRKSELKNIIRECIEEIVVSESMVNPKKKTKQDLGSHVAIQRSEPRKTKERFDARTPEFKKKTAARKAAERKVDKKKNPDKYKKSPSQQTWYEPGRDRDPSDETGGWGPR